MTTRRPKDIGTAAETAVVRFLRENGWPHAERRALTGAVDLGDVAGTPGVCWQVKGGQAARTASDALVAAWLDSTLRQTVAAREDVGVLVVQRWRQNPRAWWAVVFLVDVARLAIPGANPSDVVPADVQHRAVRMTLNAMTDLLRSAGYGDPLTERTSP